MKKRRTECLRVVGVLELWVAWAPLGSQVLGGSSAAPGVEQIGSRVLDRAYPQLSQRIENSDSGKFPLKVKSI
jgi:hypothetical protein